MSSKNDKMWSLQLMHYFVSLPKPLDWSCMNVNMILRLIIAMHLIITAVFWCRELCYDFMNWHKMDCMFHERMFVCNISVLFLLILRFYDLNVCFYTDFFVTFQCHYVIKICIFFIFFIIYNKNYNIIKNIIIL